MHFLTHEENVECTLEDWYTAFCVYQRGGLSEKEAFFKALRTTAEYVEEQFEKGVSETSKFILWYVPNSSMIGEFENDQELVDFMMSEEREENYHEFVVQSIDRKVDTQLSLLYTEWVQGR